MTYQRFVKTTPKPRATKKSSGEEVGLLPLPLPVAVGEGEVVLVTLAVVVDMIAGSGGCGYGGR